MSKKVSLLKKITMSDCSGIARASGGFKPKVHFGADDEGNFPEQLLMRVAGIASAYALGQTNYGEFIKFNGNFAAINGKGEEFRSPYCIIPGPADGLLRNMLDSRPEGSTAGVEFAFDIMVVPDKGDRGYKFRVQPLMERPQGDPLDALVGAVAQNFALPAPVEKQPELPLADKASEQPQADPAPAAATGKKK